MTIIQFKKTGGQVHEDKPVHPEAVNRLKDVSGRLGAAFVLTLLGLLKGVRQVLFLVLLWVKPVIVGFLNFLCVILLLAGGLFYFLPRFNEHWQAILVASFACFLLSFAYETIIFKLAGDDAVRLY